MIENYARKNNEILDDAQLIGAAQKFVSLGFSYHLFYSLPCSALVMI